MTIDDAAAMQALGARLAAIVRAGDVILLDGPLGAGKTTLARGLLQALGLQGEAPSPSFAIVQPYEPPEVALPVRHVDLYRVERPGEIEELGLEDGAEDALTIVEWPSRAGQAAWPDALRLTLTIAPSGARRLTAMVPEGWRARWSSI